MLRVALVGRPNVGKSTLFNRFVGRHLAITAETPGTTRDRLECVITLRRLRFLLTDIGGITTTQAGELDSNVQAQAKYALENSEVLIFLIDAKTELTTDDFAVAEILRRTNKPLIFVANKFESQNEAVLLNFTNLGFGAPLGLSALHQTGLDELGRILTKILRKIAKTQNSHLTATQPQAKIRVVIVGRPNVGKSSLANKILNEKRFIVSDRPLTTRDSTAATLATQAKTFELQDTAGLRRAGKIGRGIDRFATGRTLNALATADVALLLLDGSTKIVAQDLRVASKILQAGCALVLAVNKIDSWKEAEKQQQHWLQQLAQRFAFLAYVPVVFVSAKTGKNLPTLLAQAERVYTAGQQKIATPQLNKVLQKALLERPPARKKDLANSPPKIFYGVQIAGKSPTLTLFVNRPQAFHFSWRRFLAKRLRAEFGLAGNPLQLIFRKRPKRD